jgi:hypothetical protein
VPCAAPHHTQLPPTVTFLPRFIGLAVYGKFYAAGCDAALGVLAFELRVKLQDDA